MRMYTQKCTIVRREKSGRDAYNNMVTVERRIEDVKCWYTHQQSAEFSDRGDAYAEAYLFQCPAQYYQVVRGCDAIEIPELGTFELDGEPLYQPNGFRVSGYCQARIVRVRG